MPPTRKYGRKSTRTMRMRRMIGGERHPIEFFIDQLITQEEYNAYSPYKQSEYEFLKVYQAIDKIIPLISQEIPKEDKLYYIELMFKFIKMTNYKLITSPEWRSDVLGEITAFEKDNYVKEHGSAELFETVISLKQFINDINNMSPELLTSIIKENDVQRLKHILSLPATIKILDKTPNIVKLLFQGSDEMIPLFIYYSNNSKNKYPIISYIIDPSYDVDEFVKRIKLLNAEQGVKVEFEMMISQPTKNKEKIDYILQSGIPLNIHSIYPFTFSIASHKGFLLELVDYILRHEEIKDVRFINWIRWLYANAPESEKISKTKQCIDKLFASKITTSELESYYLQILGLDKQIYEYTIQKIVEYKKIGAGTFSFYLSKTINNGYIESIKALLSLGMHTNEMLDKEITKTKNQEVKALLESYRIPEKIWKGWTRADISMFDMIFSDEGVEQYSICPVCLKYVQRVDGCLYMSHDCSALPGFYNKRLYELYAWNEYDAIHNNNNNVPDIPNIANNIMPPQQPQQGLLIPNNWWPQPANPPMIGGATKKITWCTTCGRICYGHQHYKLGSSKSPTRPGKHRHGTDPFEKDCRKTNYGGGHPEKVARYRRAREFALELQQLVDAITESEALERLTEEMWDAPLTDKKSEVNRIISEQSWNIPSNQFPLPGATNEGSNAPNVPTPPTHLPPIIHPEAHDQFQNAIGYLDDNIIQFRHEGNMHDKEGQQISRDYFVQHSKSIGTDISSEGFLRCWQYVDKKDREGKTVAEIVAMNHCEAKLYPMEVRVAMGLAENPEEGEDTELRKLYEGYRKLFNKNVSGLNT